MKKVLWVAAVLAFGVGEARAQAGKGGKSGMDGKWMIVYAEEGGRRNNSWENRQAMVAGNTLSYEGEGGKKLSLTLTVGKGHQFEHRLRREAHRSPPCSLTGPSSGARGPSCSA